MYCKNCGKELDAGASFCVSCGFKTSDGGNFCRNCGAQVNPGAAVCTNCGCALNSVIQKVGTKSRTTAGILGILLGGVGAHNWYLGYTGKAIAQICLSLCFGVGYIWGLIEGIMILCGSINEDADGNPLI